MGSCNVSVLLLYSIRNEERLGKTAEPGFSKNLNKLILWSRFLTSYSSAFLPLLSPLGLFQLLPWWYTYSFSFSISLCFHFLFVFWCFFVLFCDSQNNLPVLCSFPTWPHPAFGSSPGWPVMPPSCGETVMTASPLFPLPQYLPQHSLPLLTCRGEQIPLQTALSSEDLQPFSRRVAPSDCWLQFPPARKPGALRILE